MLQDFDVVKFTHTHTPTHATSLPDSYDDVAVTKRMGYVDVRCPLAFHSALAPPMSRIVSMRASRSGDLSIHKRCNESLLYAMTSPKQYNESLMM